MNDIIDTLEDLISTVSYFAESIESLRQDLRATVRDCEQLASEIDELREAADK